MRLLALSWVLSTAVCIACSANESDAPAEATPSDYEKSFENTASLVIRLANEPACEKGVDIDRETFARCAGLELASLSDPLSLYDDPTAFDPLSTDGSFLVGKTEEGWLAITGLGKLPDENDGELLTGSRSLHPQFIPLLVGAGEVLIELGAGALLRQAVVGGARLLLGRAAVAEGGAIVNGATAARTARAASTLLKAGQQPLLRKCEEEGVLNAKCDVSKCLLLQNKKGILCGTPGGCSEKVPKQITEQGCAKIGAAMAAASNCAQARREAQLCFKKPDFEAYDGGHQGAIDQQCDRFMKCMPTALACQAQNFLTPRQKPSECASMPMPAP